jgi:hypothetical protein
MCGFPNPPSFLLTTTGLLSLEEIRLEESGSTTPFEWSGRGVAVLGCEMGWSGNFFDKTVEG